YRGGENPVLNRVVIIDDIAYTRRELDALAQRSGVEVDQEMLATRGAELATVARSIVYDYWPGVESLAAALQERGLLQGIDVRRLLRDVIGAPPRTNPH